MLEEFAERLRTGGKLTDSEIARVLVVALASDRYIRQVHKGGDTTTAALELALDVANGLYSEEQLERMLGPGIAAKNAQNASLEFANKLKI